MAEDDLELEANQADDAEGDAGAAASSGAGSGRLKIILIVAAVAVVLGASIFVMMKPEEPVAVSGEQTPEGTDVEADESAAVLADEGAVLPLDTLLVNLTDEDKSRFVRARVELVFGTQKEMEAVQESAFAVAKAKHVALSLLATKRSAELSDAEGRTTFRQELVRELSKNLKGIKVVDVLLTDFIIQ